MLSHIWMISKEIFPNYGYCYIRKRKHQVINIKTRWMITGTIISKSYSLKANHLLYITQI